MTLDGKKILVVDDEPSLCEVVGFQIEIAGAKVYSAESVTTALEILENEQIDAVASDVMMPERDGIDLLREIRAKSEKLPVLLMTGYTSHAHVELYNIGASNILMKPVERAVLVETLAVLLRREGYWLTEGELPFLDGALKVSLEGGDSQNFSHEDLSWCGAGVWLKTRQRFDFDQPLDVEIIDAAGNTLCLIKGIVKVPTRETGDRVGIFIYKIFGTRSGDLAKNLLNYSSTFLQLS